MDYEEQYDKIYRYCYYKLQQKEMAEDITQETFLRFFQKEQYQSGENPLRVMYTIARNLCIDEYRRKNAFLSEDMDRLADKPYDRDIEEDILTGRLLKDAMETLSRKEREMIFLRIVNEESCSVIGSMFHISRYAVYRKCRQALKKLRKELEK